MSLTDRIKSGWNAFMGRDAPKYQDYGASYYTNPSRVRLTIGNERSIVNAIYNRIAIDVASVKLEHVELDANNRYVRTIDSGLNRCLSEQANIDQTGRMFIQSCVMSMLDEGCVALVPTAASNNPNMNDSYDIWSLRSGRITQWYPKHVRVDMYNEETGRHQEFTLPKKSVAIIENPFYAIMNEPNSTLKRLIRKLNILDLVDEQSASGKLDLIMQFPYPVKTPARLAQAEERRKAIETQLNDSKYGIAWADSTEKITQLNRPLENNLIKTIEYLTTMLYGQLGITEEVLNGTADETVMLNYYNRTIEPILSAYADEIKRKFLTRYQISQHKSIWFVKDPFKLVPVANLADIADKFTRNAILSSNEVRAIIGYKPVDDPKADELRNKNLNEAEGEEAPMVTEEGEEPMGTSNLDFVE